MVDDGQQTETCQDKIKIKYIVVFDWNQKLFCRLLVYLFYTMLWCSVGSGFGPLATSYSNSVYRFKQQQAFACIMNSTPYFPSSRKWNYGVMYRLLWFNNLRYKLKRQKVKQSVYSYRLGQALRVPEGWGSQISIQLAHEGGKVVNQTHQPPLPPRKYSWYSFLLEDERTSGL